MLSPKIHRYNMFPARCIQLPCRNIDVTIVAAGGTVAISGGSWACPSSTAGMTPSEKIARLNPGASMEACQK
jgi:hypothetical protein